jgi:hypothetical protein
MNQVKLTFFLDSKADYIKMEVKFYETNWMKSYCVLSREKIVDLISNSIVAGCVRKVRERVEHVEGEVAREEGQHET